MVDMIRVASVFTLNLTQKVQTIEQGIDVIVTTPQVVESFTCDNLRRM